MAALPTRPPTAALAPARGVARLAIAALTLMVVVCAFFPAPVAAATPTLSTVSTATAGQTITVQGSGFRSRTRIAFTWDGSVTGMPTTTVANNGRFSVSLRVPPTASAGVHAIAAVAAGAVSGTPIARRSITVVAPATPAPSPTPTPKPSPTPTPTPSPTPTPKPSPTPTPTPAPTPTTAPSPTPTPATVALGVYAHGFPSSVTALDQFNTLVGRPASIAMYYQVWTSTWNAFCPTCADAAIARGAMPLVTWEPWVTSKSIAAGEHDTYLRAYLTAVATWGKPIYIRPMHEMNGDWYPWSYGVNGNTAADLQNAFRRIVTVGRSVGATNVRWVWSPNVGQFHRVSHAAIYPGDAYVDWLGLDGYNWGTSQTWSGWQSIGSVMQSSYDSITALSTRPLMIGETGASELGGDKAAWIRNGFLTELPAKMPRIRAVVWFNENKETDWRVNSSTAALTAYREVAASARYQGKLP